MEIKKTKPQTRRVYSKIPASILENRLLNEMAKEFPSNYNFEIHKTIWRIEKLKKELSRVI